MYIMPSVEGGIFLPFKGEKKHIKHYKLWYELFAIHRYRGYPDFKVLILFSKESTQGVLLHTISHMTGGGIGLRHLCDWLVFENSVPEEEFLDIFEDQLKDIGLWTFAKVMTKIGVLYFGTKRNWCLDADDEVCWALLEDILSGGNFGTKDNTRRSQAKLIQNRVTKSVHVETVYDEGVYTTTSRTFTYRQDGTAEAEVTSIG